MFKFNDKYIFSNMTITVLGIVFNIVTYLHNKNKTV